MNVCQRLAMIFFFLIVCQSQEWQHYCIWQQQNIWFYTNKCPDVFSVQVRGDLYLTYDTDFYIFFQTFCVNIAGISDKLDINTDFFSRRSLLISLRSQMNLNINAPKGIGLPPASPSDKENNVDVRYYDIRAIF